MFTVTDRKAALGDAGIDHAGIAGDRGEFAAGDCDGTGISRGSLELRV
jgi:hypothetical protein